MASPALCSSCGAPVPIVVFETSRCRHCGGGPDWTQATVQRLRELRARLEQSAAATRQFDSHLARFGRGVGAFEIGTGALLWGFLGGILIAGAAGNLTDQQSFWSLLWDPPSDEVHSFADATFWMTFITVLGFAVCCLLAGTARLIAQRQVRFAFPAPPTEPGGAPGCRLCGADLDDTGFVRRCRYCHADNLVDGVHFQRGVDDLDARLRARELAVKTTLADRRAMVQRLEKLVMGPPFATLLLFPVVFWMGQPDPAWWSLPAALFALTGLLFVAASRMQSSLRESRPRAMAAPADGPS